MAQVAVVAARMFSHKMTAVLTEDLQTEVLMDSLTAEALTAEALTEPLMVALGYAIFYLPPTLGRSALMDSRLITLRYAASSSAIS